MGMCQCLWRPLSVRAWTGRLLASASLVLCLLAGQPVGSLAQTASTDQSLMTSLSFADRNQPIDIRSQRLEFFIRRKTGAVSGRGCGHPGRRDPDLCSADGHL